jgi:hypothetical protein
MARVLRDGEQPEADQAAAEVTVAVGTARIVVRRGFDAELLRAVVDALRVPA